MPNKWLRIIGFSFLILAVARIFVFFAPKDIGDKEFNEEFNNNYGVYALSLPENIFFAKERVPLEDPEVYERLDKEMLVNTYWQSNGLLVLKRANRFLPEIERILKEEGVPEDFKYLAIVESGLTQVVSPAGATGFWQILKETAIEKKLEVNDYVDERYHIEKSTRAACRYLKEAHGRFGSWTLAAASYNMGMNGLARQLERQRVSDYYSLLLNNETSRYMFRILAVKQIIEDPEYFGFHLRKKDLYNTLSVSKVEIDTSITDLVGFAESYSINYKTLKYFNPWLRETYLKNPLGKKYVILLPKEDKDSWINDGSMPELNSTDSLSVE